MSGHLPLQLLHLLMPHRRGARRGARLRLRRLQPPLQPLSLAPRLRHLSVAVAAKALELAVAPLELLLQQLVLRARGVEVARASRAAAAAPTRGCTSLG